MALGQKYNGKWMDIYIFMLQGRTWWSDTVSELTRVIINN